MVGPLVVFSLLGLAVYEVMKPKPLPLPQATTATGASGTAYGVSPVSVQGQTTTYDVYLLSNGVRVMRYSHVTGAPTGALVESPLAATDPVLVTARRDFAV